ncbi:MAG: hypothetical protein KF773_40675 [Deltaproteobacteria bacterium]|nr:hypothetical protein [Deltaproteobacteria bacterium]
MIGEVLAAACRDPEVLARIGGPAGAAARAALSEAPLDRRRRAAWAVQARATVPAGLRGVHPSWIEAGLAGLPARARADVANAAADPAGVWLARWAIGGIPPMPAIATKQGAQVTHPANLDEALAMSGVDLRAWLLRTGVDQVAAAAVLGGLAPPALREAIARVQVPPRAGALGAPRAIAARCAGVALDDDGLLRIAARAIAPHAAARPLADLVLAHRLARSEGLAVLAELRAHVTSPLSAVPTWAALAAD